MHTVVANSDLINEAAVCRLIGGTETPIHKATLWRGINAGRYPKPIKVGPSINRWRASEVLAMLDHMAQARG